MVDGFKSLILVFKISHFDELKYTEPVFLIISKSGNTLETYDYHFVSGPKHIHKQKDMDIHIPEEKLIKIGYPKFDDYINGRIDKEKYYDFLNIKDKERRNILYAPTWKWGNGTLEKYGKRFIKELDKSYNLIIRPHFHDRGKIKLLKLWAKYNGYKNVYFSNPAKIIENSTMNDFAISDLMISDTSSIIYEYLVTKSLSPTSKVGSIDDDGI